MKRTILTGRGVVIWHRHVAVERDSDLTALVGLELLTINLDSVGMSENERVASTEWGMLASLEAYYQEQTYIHGSVLLSPASLRERSEQRPGAKTPRPYPRIAVHHGSLRVILDRDYRVSQVQR